MNELFIRRKFINLYPVLPWLTQETKDTIIAAFGAEDGQMIITATNEYLHTIAKTDEPKAITIAGLINEDPMMVCSLGLEPQGVTMPIRYMNSDGSTHIDSGYKPNQQTRVVVEIKRNAQVSSWDFPYGVGMYTQTHRFYICFYSDKFQIYAGQKNTGSAGTDYPTSIVNGKKYVVDESPVNSYIDGVLVQTSTTQATASPVNMWIGTDNNNNSNNGVAKAGFGNFQIYDNGEEVRHFVPFIRNNQIGMLDILSNTFYTVTGNNSWYMDYNLPDGQPWTPPTP